MDVWHIIYKEVNKESPATVLTFLARSVYGWSLKRLGNNLDIRPDYLSRKVNRLMHRIRAQYEENIGDIGTNAAGRYDGHLISMEL